ncbi:MgtC/SapB family protein [Azospirillum sp. YIM DDC1]|jgi:putative Mg2+ transporter-C (MgtC) family protein|uniref:Protein MgtC n=1 Tax=Azospirillum aestuarii TaxID=2802052 RepID=A0ABS1HUB3_9PROT|nr:MgtC/SapB family protein [Azospirillum aestuarii]MBK4718428.1 MgtC/SapB family protein [Azospirillum aestuarii]TWA95046.1 putative Mg2+ transporter-C (MgtC) family protein [Azospirillum brasilense]
MLNLSAYWSPAELAVNGVILLHLVGALGLGILMGYERSFHGRAAGMRTYALVCLASTALTVVNAYPGQWYGGIGSGTGGDPTRVIQGIVTGIGFLGAGVIMREGFSIRGLSTAASIWTAAAVGVTIGLGFYAAAIGAAFLVILVMSVFRRLETALPHHTVVQVMLVFERDHAPPAETIRAKALEHGYEIVSWAFHLRNGSGHLEYQLTLQANGTPDPMELIDKLAHTSRVVEFRLSPSRM